MPYLVSRKTLFPVIRRGIQSVKGLENLPQNRPFVIAANHQGLFDPLFIGAPLVEASGRLLRFLVDPTKRYWRYIGRYTNWWSHAIPVPAISDDHDAWFTQVVRYLQQGDCIGIFPEGEISQKPHLLKPKTGVVRIAQEANVPIVPIGLSRSRLGLPSAIIHSILGADGVRLRIGKPITLKPGLTPQEQQVQANAIMEELSTLSGIPFPLSQHL